MTFIIAADNNNDFEILQNKQTLIKTGNLSVMIKLFQDYIPQDNF